MNRLVLLLLLIIPLLRSPLLAQATVQTLAQGIYVPRGVWAAGDSSKLILQDTTLAVSGKRVIEGSLHSDQFNCVNAVLRGNTYDCAGSYELYREKEKLTSYHNSARGDSGQVHPAEFRAQITTAGDSLVITDVLTGKMFAAVVKAANNACGNSNFNDVDFDDGVYTMATAGGVCQIDLLADAIWFYSTSGVGKYQGTFQTRNSALGTTTYNASPAIINNTVTSAVAIRDTFGKRDGLGRLAQKWGAATAGGGSIFDAYLNGIYDSSDTNSWLWSQMLAGGGWIAATSDATRDDIQWHYSGFSKTADAFTPNEQWDNNSSGSEDLAWTSSAVISRIAAVERTSAAGTGAPVVVAGSDEGAYFLHGKANDNANGVKIRLTNTYIAAPEFGDCVLSAINGDNTTDASPYGATLAGVGGSPGFTAASGSVVFSGGFSSKNNYYMRVIDTATNRYRTTAAQPHAWVANFKSSSATNPTFDTYLFARQSNNSNQEYIYFLANSGYMRGVYKPAAGPDIATGATDVLDGNWHQLVLNVTGTTVDLYLDGKYHAQDAAMSAGVCAADTVVIGDYVGGAGAFQGLISQVAMHKRALTPIEIEWSHSRMLKSLQVPAAERRLSALDVDYVQANGNLVIMGNQDTAVVWDAQLGLPLPNRRYASPLGNIQDAALRSVGGDSLGVTMVTTTRTQQIVPDVRLLDLASRTFPFVQPGIGERVVVDSSGTVGWFWDVDSAIDAAANADRSSIFILDGTYPQFDADQANQTIEGESWDTVINGGIADDAIDVTAAKVTIKNLSLKTTGGGGQTFDCLMVGGANFTAKDCQFLDSDNVLLEMSGNIGDGNLTHCYFVDADNTASAVHITGPRWIISGCWMLDGCALGIDGDSSGDNALIIGNQVDGNITLAAGMDNSAVVGNMVDGTITDNSTSSTVSGNESY